MSSETFSYKGISAGKYIEGEIEALNQEEASFKLKEQKVIITNLTKVKKKKAAKDKKKGGGFSFGKKKIKPEDVVIFSKQFATMVKAGLPILNVLGMLRDQIEHPTMKEIIEDIRKSLEGGITLSKCFEKYPQIFDSIYINLIKAGEASGKLDVFLMKLVESLEKREKVKKKIKSALTYPVVMFTVAITVMVFMLIKVVPVFAEMYEGMGVALPTPTAVIMTASNFMRGSGGLTLGIVTIILFLIFRFPFFAKNSTRNLGSLLSWIKISSSWLFSYKLLIKIVWNLKVFKTIYWNIHSIPNQAIGKVLVFQMFFLVETIKKFQIGGW